MALLPHLLLWLEDQEITFFHPLSLSLLLLFSLFFVLRLDGAWAEKSKLPPSPPKLPILGNLHQLGTFPHRSLQALSKKYGPLMLLHLGHTPTLVVSSAEMAREIMKTHDLVFLNRPVTTAVKVFLYGCTDVAFAPYGEYWRQMRKICVLELLSVKRVQSFQYAREEEAASMIEKISDSCSFGVPVNLSKLLLTLTNNIISRIAFGKKNEEQGSKNEFAELTTELAILFGAFSVGDMFPSLGWIDVLTGLYGRMKRTSKALDCFFDQVIEDHVIPKRSDGQADRKDFVDLLLDIQKDCKFGISLTRDNIKALIQDMFVAGTDTTYATLEWAMAELVKNPNVMKKTQEEVRRVVGKKSKVDEKDVHQMDYLKSVVKEVLRLHPPLVMSIPRESTSSTNIKGYDIPPKTRVLINLWAIQRDPKSWDSPDEFIPERFINNSIDCKGLDFQFIPFGGGRRVCPGISFSFASVEFALANLLHRFDWELPGGDLNMAEAFGLTVHMKFPLHLVPMFHSS